MRKTIAIFLSIMMCFLTACNMRESDNGAGINPEAFVILDSKVWPQNEYTEELPVPAGRVNNAYIDSQNKFCFISVGDISETEFDEYIASLKNKGYSETEYVTEKIQREGYTSIGALYSNGTTSISASFADSTMGMYIVREYDVQQ